MISFHRIPYRGIDLDLKILCGSIGSFASRNTLGKLVKDKMERRVDFVWAI